MLKTHQDRVCTFFAVDFEPILRFEARLPEAAELIHARLKMPHWGYGPGKFVFRDTTKRLIILLDFRRFSFQTLGLEPWTSHLEEYAELTLASLQKIGVGKLKRIGFNTQAYLPIGMSHAEMADLMPGSYLAAASDLQDVCGKFEDVLVQLHGSQDTMKIQLIVAPMTKDQAIQQFMATSNLEAFLEPKLADTGVKDFRDRVALDCLHVSLDFSRTELATSETSTFLKRAFNAADTMTGAAVQKLKSLRAKRGR